MRSRIKPTLSNFRLWCKSFCEGFCSGQNRATKKACLLFRNESSHCAKFVEKAEPALQVLFVCNKSKLKKLRGLNYNSTNLIHHARLKRQRLSVAVLSNRSSKDINWLSRWEEKAVEWSLRRRHSHKIYFIWKIIVEQPVKQHHHVSSWMIVTNQE